MDSIFMSISIYQTKNIKNKDRVKNTWYLLRCFVFQSCQMVQCSLFVFPDQHLEFLSGLPGDVNANTQKEFGQRMQKFYKKPRVEHKRFELNIYNKNRLCEQNVHTSDLLSGREDLNLRPLAPHASALAGLRYAPNTLTVEQIIRRFAGYVKGQLPPERRLHRFSGYTYGTYCKYRMRQVNKHAADSFGRG
jgi:hypothetical protein